MTTFTQPSRSLLDPNKATQHQYVRSEHTDLKAQWASFFAEHRKPETAESYQRSVIEETR